MLEVIVVLAISIVVSAYISKPFFLKSRLEEPSLEEERNGVRADLMQRLKALRDEKDSLYNSIKDIEFDYEIGKLSKKDFEELDISYKRKAIYLIKEIDEAEGRINLTGTGKKAISDAKSVGEGKSVQAHTEMEILRSRKPTDTIDPHMKCLNCGKDCNRDDIFCSKCGNKL